MSYRRLKKLDINVLFKGQITVDTNGRYQMHITAYAQYIEIAWKGVGRCLMLTLGPGLHAMQEAS